MATCKWPPARIISGPVKLFREFWAKVFAGVDLFFASRSLTSAGDCVAPSPVDSGLTGDMAGDLMGNLWISNNHN